MILNLLASLFQDYPAIFTQFFYHFDQPAKDWNTASWEENSHVKRMGMLVRHFEKNP